MVRVTREQLEALTERYAKNRENQIQLSQPRPRYRIETSDLSDLRPHFQGKDVFVIGSGPSLYGIDWSVFEGKPTICINNTIKWFKKPTIHTFLDLPVLQQGGLSPGVPVVTKTGNNVPEHNNKIYKILVGRKYSETPEKNGFYSAYSTGHVAINLAIYFKAKRIFLLGLEKGFLGESQFKELKKYMDSVPWYKNHHDILEQAASCKKKGYDMGHFYTPWMPHGRDRQVKSYNVAGDRLDPFYGKAEIYQLTPIHFTKFPFKSINEI